MVVRQKPSKFGGNVDKYLFQQHLMSVFVKDLLHTQSHLNADERTVICKTDI